MSAPRGGRRSTLLLCFIVAAFTVAAIARLRPLPPAAFTTVSAGPTPGAGPRFRTDFVSARPSVQSHAVSVVELGDGRIRAFWYSGTEEGAVDVTIQTAVFDPVAGRWGPERAIATPEAAQSELWRYVKKVGNPSVGRAADDSLKLFYVTVSVGGWSGSSINAMTSHDDGYTWSRAERIITTPFFNLSTLAKGPPFNYSDGTLSLPVYEEFMGKFGELLRLGPDDRLIDKTRLSFGRSGLQPIVLVQGPERATAFLRHSGPHDADQLLRVETDDAGRHWSPPASASLPNADTAMAGLVLPDGRLLIAFNSSAGNRTALSLAVSADGGYHWKVVYALEDQSGPQSEGLDRAHFRAVVARLARASDATVQVTDTTLASVERLMGSPQGYSFEFSYPSLIRTRGGEFHLVYTWNRAFLKHVEFNQAWLDARLAEVP